MVVSNAHEKFGFLHISFYKIVQIVLPIILYLRSHGNNLPMPYGGQQCEYR